MVTPQPLIVDILAVDDQALVIDVDDLGDATTVVDVQADASTIIVDVGSTEQGLPGPPGVVWRGAWTTSALYDINDVVQYQGSTYIALKSNGNIVPTSRPDVWELFTAKGDTGPSAQPWTISRAANLVSNANGYLGDNTNFSSSTFLATDRPYGYPGCFEANVSPAAVDTDEFIPVEPTHRYFVGAWMREVGTSGGTGYLAVTPFDADGNSIESKHVMYRANTLTTLAADLKPGDTVVQLTSAANWQNAGQTYERSLIFWNYSDSKGFTWGPSTYSRNVYQNVYGAGGITGNTITLATAWTGPTIVAGTQVSNATAGATYIYIGWVGGALSQSWVWRDCGVAYLGGINTTGTGFGTQQVPYGCVKIKITARIIGGTNPRLRAVGIMVKDVTPAIATAVQSGISLDASNPGTIFISANPGLAARYDLYTAAGAFTWTKPAGARLVRVIIQSGGAGGGSGGRGATNVSRSGGSGGGGGGRVETWFAGPELPATVSGVVGAGGTGGAAVGADNTAGTNGTDGGKSRFGTGTTTTWSPSAGAAGQGGKVDGTSAASSSGPVGTTPSTAQGSGALGATTAYNPAWYVAAMSGAGGGGLSAVNAAFAGGASFGPPNTEKYTLTSGGAGGAGAGTNGPSIVANFPTISEPWPAGLGGTGGGSGAAGVGGNGGDGYRGGGGGGGGASANGFASGAGGKGGDGYVQVITYF